MAEINIRRAGPADTADIQGLLAVQLAEHDVAISADDLARAIDGVFSVPSRGLFLVAEVGGMCVGTAYLSLIWALEHGGQSGWLEELYVAPEHRNATIGSQLLTAVIAEAVAAGCAALDLEIDAGHERVHSLYDRHGFSPLPRRRIVRKLVAD